MLKDKDKSMDGVNESDDVLEQAAGGGVNLTKGWKFRVYDDKTKRRVGIYKTRAEAEKVDREING